MINGKVKKFPIRALLIDKQNCNIDLIKHQYRKEKVYYVLREK